jgi:hypothetical protein
MKNVLLLVLGWFIIINIFAVIANNRVTLLPDTAYRWINPQYTFQQQGWDPTALHSRWDSYFYLDIARNGYSYKSGQLSNIVFFPLYPFLMAIGALFLNNNFVLAGWIVSSVFTFLSAVYLYKLVKDFHKDADPLLAVFLFLIFPTAFFLNSVYTESTFILF